jgi:hypothetical protein
VPVVRAMVLRIFHEFHGGINTAIPKKNRKNKNRMKLVESRIPLK